MIDSTFLVTINIKNVVINTALLDIGADVTCVSSAFAKRFGSKVSNSETVRSFLRNSSSGYRFTETCFSAHAKYLKRSF
ncbi:hypothetical protein ENBRE01_1471 [Enteropsectra breve]|nr:hypothetical protein ENBRE01_1471 [Enteropsectra breve]